jgi:hypothetical protein
MNAVIRNKNIGAICVILEPWAEEFILGPGSTLSINIFCTEFGLLETETSPEYFTIWLWNGCRAQVFLDGDDQTPRSFRIPAPG